MTRRVHGANELTRFVSEHARVSDWLTISQERVTAFGRCTDDLQWIHVDEERAAAGLFGGTIAHGFLTLSLITRLWEQTVKVSGFAMTVNYGLDRVRFPAPLLVDSRIRARFEPKQVTRVTGGLQMAMTVTIEREGHDKPVCVAETLVRYYE